ncbi:MAG TPA: protoporphyrinogen oxidase [Streptosporangiaceae bacterium]|nr:protoporphyrinogen oxidase [Streptosporangiaceae bacterium]
MNRDRSPCVVVVGGGIAGLSAAFFLRGTPATVTVLEGSERLGGKLAVSEVAGVAVDEGAEAVLTRRPEGTDLIQAAGLSASLMSPATTRARLYSRGQLHSLPHSQFMGVPADLDELARCRLLSSRGMARAWQDLDLPATMREGDVAVAEFVGARFGREVVERLVDPILCGVYAGRSEDLSFEATLPALADRSRCHASLAEAAASIVPADRPSRAATQPSVFSTIAGGLGTLPAAVATASGATVRTKAMVREMTRTATGWRLTVGSAHRPESVAADAVVLALPARPASRLLAGVTEASAGAAALGEIDYASMVIVTLAYPASAFPRPLDSSGYLIPAVDGHPVKAVTFSSAKWPHLTGQVPGIVIVRCSLGRTGEEHILQADDTELVTAAADQVTATTGVHGLPVATRVTRWGGALPQYTVGHLGRVATIRSAIARLPGLAVCGAAYDGVGIPACVATARMAARQVADHLGLRWEHAGERAGTSGAPLTVGGVTVREQGGNGGLRG